MQIFKIDNACAGRTLRLESGNSENWFCILADYGLVSFKLGGEVMFASGRLGQVVFDTVQSVDVDSQTLTLTDYGPIEIRHLEYFARM